MKKKSGFTLRDVCGEHVMVAEGKENIDFSNIISMNETSAYLWTNMGEGTFSVHDMADALLEEYDVDEATALADSKALAEQWVNAGIVEP